MGKLELQNNKNRIAKRRQFPLVQKVDHLKFDINQIRSEFESIQSKSDWSDMTDESPLVKDLIKGRDHLTKCFANENGKYENYHQILLTEGQPLTKVEPTEVRSKASKYRMEINRLDPQLNEANYNKPREFMSQFPYLSKAVNSFSDPIMRARFAKIGPGFSIAPHIDYDIPYGTRFHMAITSNKDSFIRVRRSPKDEFESYNIPCDGHFYFVNVGFEHYAENAGTTERTHLVVSVNGHSDILNYSIKS